MNLPEITSREDLAVDIVTSVINKAQEKLGIRQNLVQLAKSRNILASKAIVSLATLKPPLALTSEKLIKDCIEKIWRLGDVFHFHLKYLELSSDECAQHYYYEAIFSQPTVAYPIPQVTVSVFFRVEDSHIEPPELKRIPEIYFRVEGQYSNHDIRYVRLIPDWILAVMQMKLKFFKRVERIKLF